MKEQQQRPYFPLLVKQPRSGWHWGMFLIYCVLLIVTGWLCGFFVPYGVAMVIGSIIGLVAGLCRWFEDEETYPRQN